MQIGLLKQVTWQVANLGAAYVLILPYVCIQHLIEVTLDTWPRLPRLREVAALLSPSTMPGETNAQHLLTAGAALPHIRVETLIDSQANYEIKIKITIYFYKIMISYEKYSTMNLY